MADREPFSEARKPNVGPSGGRPYTADALNQTRQQGSDLSSQVQQSAGEAAEQAKQQVTSRLSEQKFRAADGVRSIAGAVRRTGSQLREQDQGPVAEYAESAASQLERFSTYLRDAEVEEMVDDVERFARRQPAVFLGGAVLLGFLGARFLGASRMRRGTMSEQGAGYGQQRARLHDIEHFRSTRGTPSPGSSTTTPQTGTSRSGSYDPYPRVDPTTTGTGSTGGSQSTTNPTYPGTGTTPGTTRPLSNPQGRPGMEENPKPRGTDEGTNPAGGQGVR